MDISLAAQQQQQHHLHQYLQLQPARAIPERADDGSIAMGGSEDGSSSKLWDRVVADDRRIGSEECLKLWMELEARCSADGRGLVESIKDVVDEMVPPPQPQEQQHQQQPKLEGHQRVGGGEAAQRILSDGDITMRLRSGDGGRSGGGDETSNNGDRQGTSTNREKEEWSPAEAITLLEAYEERLSQGKAAANLKAKEWEEVVAAVNRHFHVKSVGANKSLKQCKRKLYALRRWYKTVVSRQMTFRQDGYEHTLLCVLERIMTPSSPCPAGIPGGIDAGERQVLPQTPSLFDEEEEEAEELIQATRAVMPPELGERFAGMVSSMQSGKRTGIGAAYRKRRAGQTCYTAGSTDDSNCGGVSANLSNKKACTSCCGATTHSDEVVSALNSFAKVLAQVEQTKMDIMRDLDRRHRELQLKLANVDHYQLHESDAYSPSAMLTLL